MTTNTEPTLDRAAAEALQKDVVARFKRLEAQQAEPLNAKAALRLAADACGDRARRQNCLNWSLLAAAP